jgi:hypothetical protein
VADQIERQVGGGDVFFEDRPVAAPLGKPVAEDEAIISETQEVLE